MPRGRTLLVGAAFVLLALYSFRTPLLQNVGGFLVEEDPLAAADAIAVPSGSFPDRVLEAATLYRDGFAPRVLLCREREGPAFKRLRALGVDVPRGFELNRSVALQLGVPPQAISAVEQLPGSTYSEARRVIREARARGYRSLLLVTSKYHTRRAGLIYRHLAGDALEIIVRPAREDSFESEAWWRSRTMTRRVIIEYQKLLVFLLLDRWRTSPVEMSSPVREGVS